MKPFATALMLVAACAAGACSPGAAQNGTPAQSPPPGNGTPREPSQLQDVGTPAGPHMLGPLSPRPSLPPPDSAVMGRVDPNAPGLDPCRPRDTSKEPKREPGPISANGALTFFGLPMAVTPEDLKAGKVEVALIGAPIDMGVGFRGAGKLTDRLSRYAWWRRQHGNDAQLAQRTEGGGLWQRPHRPVQHRTQRAVRHAAGARDRRRWRDSHRHRRRSLTEVPRRRCRGQQVTARRTSASFTSIPITTPVRSANAAAI